MHSALPGFYRTARPVHHYLSLPLGQRGGSRAPAKPQRRFRIMIVFSISLLKFSKETGVPLSQDLWAFLSNGVGGKITFSPDR